jgi:hypothetical protein
MKAVTIDNLDIKDHLRWAQDQETLEAIFVKEAQMVAQHPEIVGLSVIYSSKFEDLFELQKRNQHWAAFSPPRNFHVFGNRFFSYRLFPSIHWEDKEESEDEDPEDEEAICSDLIEIIHRVKKTGTQSSIFEKDKSAMLNLLESIKWINKLLIQINARKLQYQKG